MFSRFIVPPSAKYVDKLHQPELNGFASGFCWCGVAPFGAMEARLCLDHKYVLMGLPLDVVAGENLKEKRKVLFSSRSTP